MLDKTGFDLWADGYDMDVQLSEESGEYPFAGYREVLGTVYKTVREKMGTVLDIGFGTGVLTRKLYDDGYLITGIDFSERMIKIAAEKMPGANLIQYDFAQGLPAALGDTKFDWIISTYAIHHLTDEKKASFIRDLLGHLAEDGTIIFGDVAFQNTRDLEYAMERDRPIWDDEEDYLVADRIKGMFPDLWIDFKKISYCSGVLTIKREDNRGALNRQEYNLSRLAKLIEEKNKIDAEITSITERPAILGHVGEYIASQIFRISLEESASQKSYDGQFIDGPLAGKSVNIKWYTRRTGLLDINPEACPDFYLVLSGPRANAGSSRGMTLPWVISEVFLFDSLELMRNLEKRGVKLGIATSLTLEIWDKAKIYPNGTNRQLALTDNQIKALSLFK
ncbi:MAG: class I SAM-dependent methyltransferase [Clostridiales bacterium]|nr:class I SAM-dependent methyltransferase [Clostridiales bacterium]